MRILLRTLRGTVVQPKLCRKRRSLDLRINAQPKDVVEKMRLCCELDSRLLKFITFQDVGMEG